MAGALLFVRTLRNLTTLDAGFRQDNLLVVNLDFRRVPIPEGERVMKYQEIADHLATLPGVQSGTQAFILPVSGSSWNDNILIDGVKPKDFPNFNAVGTGYFRTMGTPILAGRDFNEHDTPDAPKVVIVNESFAKKYFGGQNPIGRTFQIEEPVGEPRPFLQIVGVVRDTKYIDLREAFGAIGYLPLSQQKRDLSLTVLLRTRAPTDTVTGEVTGAISNVSPMISIQFQTLAALVQQSLLRERLMATLSGLYGVMSYMVARRRNEIGIRMALGADRRDVVRMVMREAGLLLIAGLGAGATLAVAAARTARTLLFGLGPGDPATLAIAAGALAAVAALASYLPAQRAARLEPTIALREE